MDEIQKVLIKQGRKDLAQSYFLKLQKKLKKKAYYPQGEDKVNNRQPNSPRELALARVRVYFNDQKLLNLWENELSGQFSDGAWENTPSAKWLWESVAVGRGAKNEIVVSDQYTIKKQSFGWNTLLSIPEIKQRMIVGNGFRDESELKRALAIITTMIKQTRVDPEMWKERDKEKESIKQELEKRLSGFLERHAEFQKDYSGVTYKLSSPMWQEFTVTDVKDDKISIKLSGTLESKYSILIFEEQVDEFIKQIRDALALKRNS